MTLLHFSAHLYGISCQSCAASHSPLMMDRPSWWWHRPWCALLHRWCGSRMPLLPRQPAPPPPPPAAAGPRAHERAATTPPAKSLCINSGLGPREQPSNKHFTAVAVCGVGRDSPGSSPSPCDRRLTSSENTAVLGCSAPAPTIAPSPAASTVCTRAASPLDRPPSNTSHRMRVA
jgi:hypothetical protein